MGLDAALVLADCIQSTVEPYGFQRMDAPAAPGIPSPIASWKRKTWNTNRGIALVRMPPEIAHAGEYALDLRKPVGKSIGYIPFLYELGLQLILCRSGARETAHDLERYVTPVNNSTVILQSLHVVDLDTGASESARTWGQVITGKWIDAIEAGFEDFRERIGGGGPRQKHE